MWKLYEGFAEIKPQEKDKKRKGKVKAQEQPQSFYAHDIRFVFKKVTKDPKIY